MRSIERDSDGLFSSGSVAYLCRLVGSIYGYFHRRSSYVCRHYASHFLPAADIDMKILQILYFPSYLRQMEEADAPIFSQPG